MLTKKPGNYCRVDVKIKNQANGRGNPLPRRARNNNSRSNAGNEQIAVKKRKQKAGTYLHTVSGYEGYS